jgi:hypothetical protein
MLSACGDVRGGAGDAGQDPTLANESAQAAPRGERDPSVVSATDNPAVSEPPEVPTSWQRVRGECGISLRAPALVASLSQGVDSCVASFQGPDCSYSADVGSFSNSLGSYDEGSGYTVETVRVGDKNARLVTAGARSEGETYLVGIHIPAPIWAGNSSVTATITANCFSEAGRDAARLVLQTVQLPADNASALVPLSQDVSCSGEDIRPISGYRLGDSCVHGKVDVPGVCALGAKANHVTGSGAMLCFVSPDGDYFWAHVAYGEYVEGPGSRHGQGELWRTQLSNREEIRCNMLVSSLQDSVASPIDGEYSYRACP